jgi:hypothetical protein
MVSGSSQGLVLKSFLVHPIANEASSTIGGQTVYNKPHPAAVAALTHAQWGAEQLYFYIENCGPGLTSGTIRIAYYYYYLATNTTSVVNWKLSEVALHHDWNSAVSRAVTWVINLPMPLPMVPTSVCLGQVDVIMLEAPASSSYANSIMPLQFQIGWGGFRVATPSDGKLVPIVTAYDTEPVVRQVRQQADATTTCHSIVRLNTIKPVTAAQAAMSCELNLSFRNFARTALTLSAAPASGSNNEIYYFPGTFESNYTVTGTLAGASTTTMHTIMMGFSRWKGSPRLVFTDNASGDVTTAGYSNARVIPASVAVGLLGLSATGTKRIVSSSTAAPASDRQLFGPTTVQPISMTLNSPCQWNPFMCSVGTHNVPYSIVTPQNVLVVAKPTGGWNAGIIYEYWGEDFDVDGYVGFPACYTTRSNSVSPTSTDPNRKIRRLPGQLSLDDVVVLPDGSRVSTKEAYYRAQGLSVRSLPVGGNRV